MFAMILTWADFIDLISRPPHSLWFIFLVCLVVSLLSTILNKKLVDHDKVARIQEIVNEHNKNKKELLKMSEENPKKYAKEYSKWQRRDASVKKMQQSMTMNRMKPTCITFIPLIAFFYIIRAIYTPAGSSIQMPVARPPINPMDELFQFIVVMMRSQLFSAVGNITVSMGFLGFTGYYMLCSFSTSTILQKLFKISATSGQGGAGGASSLFDSTAQMELPKPSTL